VSVGAGDDGTHHCKQCSRGRDRHEPAVSAAAGRKQSAPPDNFDTGVFPGSIQNRNAAPFDRPRTAIGRSLLRVAVQPLHRSRSRSRSTRLSASGEADEGCSTSQPNDFEQAKRPSISQSVEIISFSARAESDRACQRCSAPHVELLNELKEYPAAAAGSALRTGLSPGQAVRGIQAIPSLRRRHWFVRRSGIARPKRR